MTQSPVTDPLRSLDNDEAEDLFKSAFNGTAGVIKITSSQPGGEQDPQQEKFDPPKPVVDTSPDPEDEDLFSDCRSDLEPEAERPPSLPRRLPAPAPRLEADFRERLQLGRGEGGGGEGGGGVAEEWLQVRVSAPAKVGEGLHSYLAYTLATRTNLRCFRRGSCSVVRRYSDFLGLHSKLVARYQSRGRIIPPAPEKNIIGATRVKMGGAGAGEGGAGAGAGDQQSDRCKASFVSRRRAALERFINRVALHPVLRLDPDFVDFLECEGELPRASSTAAISSASVFKMISRVGETVNKMTYKMEEGDTWYEEKTQHVEQMEAQLKKLHSIVEAVVGCRRELAVATGQFAGCAAVLGAGEEAGQLARQLSQLSSCEERVEGSLQQLADADYAHLLELIRDYLALVTAVKEVLGERVKAFLAWQNAVTTLHKKREQRSRMELGGRLDKMGSAIEDVTEWEQKVEDCQDNFQKISEVIKVEMELFQHYRVSDFKDIIVLYLEDVTRTQQDMVTHWEAYLEETKRVV